MLVLIGCAGLQKPSAESRPEPPPPAAPKPLEPRVIPEPLTITDPSLLAVVRMKDPFSFLKKIGYKIPDDGLDGKPLEVHTGNAAAFAWQATSSATARPSSAFCPGTKRRCWRSSRRWRLPSCS
ncbi:MAG TPA: hypothetical protein VH083_11135 [Myxococcales bacterium]|nr:hypothetical protein [Myxococcales bacterium]